MSDIAAPTADSLGQPQPSTSAGSETRWRRPPMWLWALAVAMQVVSAAALTNFAFFFIDDYVFLNQARLDSFDLAYLRANLYEHFSPLSRLLDKLLVVLAPGSWALAHGVELAIYAGALIAFAIVVRTILGNGWSAFILTILFGQSLFLIRLMYWWTATANILPSTLFMLLAIGCYLGWRERGSPMWLVGSLAAYVMALLDYDTAMLFPAYLAAISLLVMEDRPGPRAWAATLWRERWAWICYLALDAAALFNYYHFYYYRSGVRPSDSALAHYLEIAAFQTFVPALLGIHYPQAPIVTVIAAVVVGAALAATLYLRPRAWRCLAAFVLVFLATMLPVGLNRIVSRGVTIAGVLYYQQSVQFMFLVMAAFAISPRWSGRRGAARQFALAARARRAIARRWPSPKVWLGTGAALLAAYGGLYVTSARALEGKQWQAEYDHAYINTYLASDKQVRAALGHEPVLVDLRVPHRALPKSLYPFTSYGDFFALFNPRVRVDELVNPLYVVSPRGRLVAVRFATSTHGVIDRASGRASDAAAGATTTRAGDCMARTRTSKWLRVPLARAQHLGTEPDDLGYALRVRFRMPSTAQVTVVLLKRLAGRGIAPAKQTWDRGPGGEYVPVDFTGTLRAVAFSLPARACVTELAFGHLRRAQAG